MEVKTLTREEIGPAMALVWRVFSEFEAPEYSAEGTETFRLFIQPDEIIKMTDAGELRIWGAFEGEALRGVFAARGEGHICLFFVQKECHRQGIGRALFSNFECIARAAGLLRITVNASPYAAPVYRRLGFLDTAPAQVTHGIRYIPMEYFVG